MQSFNFLNQSLIYPTKHLVKIVPQIANYAMMWIVASTKWDWEFSLAFSSQHGRANRSAASPSGLPSEKREKGSLLFALSSAQPAA